MNETKVMTHYHTERVDIMGEALRKIFGRLRYIDYKDLTTAEKQILAIVVATMEHVY